MRQIVFFVFVGLAWGDNPAPTTRDAYVRVSDASTRRSARLKDSLRVEICKVDYETFAIGRDPLPALSLYFDGQLMQGLQAELPQPLQQPILDPDALAICADRAKSQFEAEAKAAADRDEEANAAEAKLAAESDPIKKEPLKKEVTETAAAAKAAKKLLQEAKSAAGARYVLEYYLDSQ